jgi:hypothetical protein
MQPATNPLPCRDVVCSDRRRHEVRESHLPVRIPLRRRSPRRSYRGAELGEQQVNDIGRCADEASLGGEDLATTAASRGAVKSRETLRREVLR